jgi:pyruvate/2-oxoglutarate dehydrogenase complex dihydrolipoamide dehydrogenase (E3) component
MSNTAAIIKTMTKTNTIYNWVKPKAFDNNIIVIGGGSAGLVTAYIAAATKAKVTLVEKHLMGGDCLNTGCVPSKALICTTRLLATATRAKEFGIAKMSAEYSFSDVMERVQAVIKSVAPHDSVERYQNLGVDVIEGNARIISPWEVEVTTTTGTQILTTLAIVIAAGARPLVPPILGIENTDYLTSDTVWNLRTQPKRLIVLGGGPIGCELAQCFARLGSHVTLVEMASRLLIREDEDASELVLSQFRKEGIAVRLGHTAKQFLVENDEKILLAEHEGETTRIPFDAILLALGRTPNTAGYGLEDIGVELSPKRTIQIDGFQATNYPNIFACGDVSGPYQFTHTAAHQAWYAAVNALFGNIKKFRTDYSIIPWATFTEPEVARVGLNEQEAIGLGIKYEASQYDIAELDRAIADGNAHGFVKVLTKPGSDKILGVTIVGDHSGDLIAEFVLAMKHGIGLDKILGTIHIYPTLAEANKYVAGIWKKNHQPEKLLQWVARYHAWRRG